MDANILASQKGREMLAAFWPRRISRYITRILVRTPITPNQTTVLWGTLSVLNSYTVYLALTGSWIAIPLIPVIYQFCFILDCVDGEIARFKNMANPIGGKLLDGICHRATEFALLATYIVAAYTITGSRLVLPIGLLLLTGDAMHIFAYERRLTALRVQAGYKGQMRTSQAGVYQRGTRWDELTRKQQVETITGLAHYKSVFAVIVLSYLSPALFLGGLAALAIYKHCRWILLVRSTLTVIAGLQAGSPGERATEDAAAVHAAGRMAH